MSSEVIHEGHGDHRDEPHHHITPVRVYVQTFLALVVLMLLTVWAATLNLGAANNVIALAIAVAKATLVVLFFMQVKYGTRLTWLWAAIGFIWLILMMTIVTDYITREWIHVQGWELPAYRQ